MADLTFLRDNARWLAAGFLLAFASSVGQTYFIALFSDPLRETFGLSQGGFGALYMLGTLASAATLIQLGRLADHRPMRALGVAAALAIALVCVAMALVAHWLMLVVVIFGLRLMGQGMLSHLSQTAMSRWFVANRGRALAVASFGYPTAEALAPLAAVGLIVAVGWRETWGLAALAMAFVVAPALWLLLSRDRTPRSSTGAVEVDAGVGRMGRHWTRGEALRDPIFWALLPGLMAPGFFITVVFFLPSHIAETKGWSFGAVTGVYWVYAVCSVAGSILSGLAVDRFSARACLGLYQAPMAVGLLILWLGQSEAAAAALFAALGLTAGASQTIHAALWAELYGVRHLGAIKALAHAAMVFASAAGPGLVGAVIDLGWSAADQAPWMALYVGGVCALFIALSATLTAKARPETGRA